MSTFIIIFFFFQMVHSAVQCFNAEFRQRKCWFIVASNLNVAAWIINTLYVRTLNNVQFIVKFMGRNAFVTWWNASNSDDIQWTNSISVFTRTGRLNHSHLTTLCDCVTESDHSTPLEAFVAGNFHLIYGQVNMMLHQNFVDKHEHVQCALTPLRKRAERTNRQYD